MPVFHTAPRRRLAPIILAAALSFGLGAAPAQSQTQDQTQPLGQPLDQVRALTPTPLDMSNPAHRAFFLEQHRLTGATVENNPDLAAFMELATAYHATNGVPAAGRVMLMMDGSKTDPDTDAATDQEVGPIQTVTSFQQDAENPKTYHASALGSIPDQPETCTHTLTVADEQGNPQGDGVQLTQKQACEAVHLSAQGTLDDGDQWAQAVMTYYWVKNGTPHAGAMSAQGSVIPTQIVSTNPNDLNGDGMIKFCFGRTGADCDYQPSGASQSNVFLPIDGYTSYDAVIEDPATSPDASVYIAISQPEPDEGGGCTLQGDVATFFTDYVTLSNEGKQINWNDPSVSFPAIDSACMPHGSIVYYTMSMNLELQLGGFRQPVFFGISSSPETPVSTGFWLQLPSTRIYYSCLAEGTEITLADGTVRTIEALDISQKVQTSREGVPMTVYATYRGEEDFLIRLRTETGRELKITKGHPVVTPGGITLAGDIRLGDRVQTLDGPERVTAADRIPYHGVVRNLSVGTAQDGVPITSHNTTFFANGILVGDNEMQWTFATERRRELLSQLGPMTLDQMIAGGAD